MGGEPDLLAYPGWRSWVAMMTGRLFVSGVDAEEGCPDLFSR